VAETGAAWHYGDADPLNLGGTYRTLDQASGPVPLEAGLVSRAGWAVVDDSKSLVFNPQGWLEPRGTPNGTRDLYFFGYGHDYAGCLADFIRVSGKVPLIPRWALGNWWSRYWAYTQQELSDLMLEFKNRQVPLSVCIVDMDWHITKTGNKCTGWTGYTWNKELFPDPDAFIRFLHEMGLRTALNLHPAEGIHPHEEMYPQMAKAMGIRPASGEPVPFDPTDKQFAKAYLAILHHPQEARGIDFWWMDWQQGNPTQLTGLNLLWWINHLHFMDHGRDGLRRPFIFSRWGGLGNHRYPIGFSGDTIISWASLAFQPYFTASAANVAYGWWSHDIGGHFDGIEDAELYTRWVQFGVFSPIFRLHCTANPYHERRPWGYDAETFRITSQAVKLRHALIPYLYSMAWRNHAESISLIRPMYHIYPDREESYACPNQYTFGSELFAAPFTSPRDPDTRLSRQAVWLPEGEWYGFFDGRYYPGDGWQALYGALDELPVFARAGAIVPLGPLVDWGGIDNPKELTVHVFPGADNRFELYEDDGNITRYMDGDYAITPILHEWMENRQRLQVGPISGNASLVPDRREISLVFHAIHEPVKVKVSVNGKPQPARIEYDAQQRNLTIKGFTLSPGVALSVELESSTDSLAFREQETLAQVEKLVRAFRMGSESKRAMSFRFADLMDDPAMLGMYAAALTKSQLRALYETISGCGIERTTCSGEDLIVLWNNHAHQPFKYLVSVEQIRGHKPAEQYYHEYGMAPRFIAFRPAKDFTRKPAMIQADYGGLVKVVYTHQMDDMYPRPGPGVF
jgi:alpha-glucosidase (family GH31 glycosyl hydrolase)